MVLKQINVCHKLRKQVTFKKLRRRDFCFVFEALSFYGWQRHDNRSRRKGGGGLGGCCVTTHPTELAGKLATLPRLFLYQINIFKAETFPI